MIVQFLMGVGLVHFIGVPRYQETVAERRDSPQALAAYLDGICPVSAKGVRKCEFSSAATSLESLDWLSHHYDGAVVEWRRGAKGSYWLDLSPQNSPESASL